jgi:hypothetical protein
MVIGCTEHLQNVTTSNYSAIADSHTLQFITAHINLLSLLCVHRLAPGNVSQRHRFIIFHVPQFRSSLAGDYLATRRCYTTV